jgi:hypothetical protein
MAAISPDMISTSLSTGIPTGSGLASPSRPITSLEWDILLEKFPFLSELKKETDTYEYLKEIVNRVDHPMMCAINRALLVVLDVGGTSVVGNNILRRLGAIVKEYQKYTEKLETLKLQVSRILHPPKPPKQKYLSFPLCCIIEPGQIRHTYPEPERESSEIEDSGWSLLMEHYPYTREAAKRDFQDYSQQRVLLNFDAKRRAFFDYAFDDDYIKKSLNPAIHTILSNIRNQIFIHAMDSLYAVVHQYSVYNDILNECGRLAMDYMTTHRKIAGLIL